MTTKIASSPFNNVLADVIITSSDEVSFYVRSAILCEASPMFQTMFSLPQPPSPAGKDNEHPIIAFTEDSKVLDTFLRIIYPVVEPTGALETLCDIHAMLSVANKYEVEVVRVCCIPALLSPLVVDTDPMGAFAIAVHHKLPVEAQAIARMWLSHEHITDSEPTWALDLIPSRLYHSLLRYRAQCAAVAIKSVESCFPDGNVSYGKQLLGTHVNWSIMQKLYCQSATRVLRSAPCGQALSGCDDLVSPATVSMTTNYSFQLSVLNELRRELTDFRRRVIDEVDQSTLSVSVKIDF